MSVAAVKITPRFSYIGADSQVTYSDQDAINHENAKISAGNGVITASAGDFMLCILFQNFMNSLSRAQVDELADFNNMLGAIADFRESVPEEYKPSSARTDVSLSGLILTKDVGYLFEDKLLIELDTPSYGCIGSGEVNARSVLQSGGSLHAALDVTCSLNIFCSYPIELYRINRRTGDIDQRIIKYPSDIVLADNKLF